MSTIQFRTDDQTKAASTALFSKLGITMSEAINLFLRQAIMRGGIPFALNVPCNDETASDDLLEYFPVVDAIRRYKSINNNADFDIASAESFLRALQSLGTQAKPRLTFYENAVKARITYKGQDFVVDFNFEEPETIFILSRKDGKLFVKDCNLADIAKTLELF